jgi:hypothetical protein
MHHKFVNAVAIELCAAWCRILKADKTQALCLQNGADQGNASK